MNIKPLSVLVGGMLTLVAMSASAAPILVAEWLGNSGAANELADVQAKILAYNVANDPDLPAFSGTTSLVQQSTSIATYAPNNEKIVEWTAPMTYDFYYVMTKFGKGQANFDHALHYVLAGETLSYNPGGVSAPNGLSHVSIWSGDLPQTSNPPSTSVPDNGFSMALLGLGAFGIARLRR